MSSNPTALRATCTSEFLITPTDSRGFSSPSFAASAQCIPGLPGRLSRWFELLQAADLPSSDSPQPTGPSAPLQIPGMDRPPAGIVELEDGYAVGSYSGAVVHVPMRESGIQEAGATVLHSPANAPVAALARGRLLYSGFRSGELAVGGEICARLGAAFPTSLHAAGPGPCELLVVGTSGGAVAMYDPAKSAFVHTVPIYSDASRPFETRPSYATVLPSLGCLCAACGSTLSVVDARIGRRAQCLELRLGSPPSRGARITALAAFPWGGVLVGTDASAVHTLDPSSAHPEDVVDTVLCHTGPVKSMSVRGTALVSGSARRLAVHALVGKELRPQYCADLDSVLCGLCPSAVVLANRTIVGVPPIEGFPESNCGI